MIKKTIIALGLLMGSLLAAWGASSTLSGLSPGTAISNSDLFYDVQSVGVGGVKVTGSQFLSYVYGNVSGACSANASGVFACNSTSTGTVGIAAGNNITTSGTSMNVTVNVVSTPSFSSVTTTLASVSGWLTASGVTMQTATVAAINGTLQCVQANSLGVLSGTGSTCGTGQFSINAGTNIATSGTANNITVSTTLTPTFTSLTSTNGSITTLTGGTAAFQTVTINNLTPTGPNCLQETGGVVQATNAACGTGGGGTPGGANTQVQFNNNGAFAGDPGFTYTTPGAVIITSGIITTSNKALSIFQTWNSSGQAFDAPLFMNITNSASNTTFGNFPLLADWQVGGATVFAVGNGQGSLANTYSLWLLGGATPSGGVTSGNFTLASDATNIILNAPQTTGGVLFSFGRSSGGQPGGIIPNWFGPTGVGFVGSNQSYFGFSSTSGPQTADVGFYRDTAVGVMAMANIVAPTVATGLRLYNTVDNRAANSAPTNYERGIFDWTKTANNLTIGTEQGGTGTGRNVLIIASGTRAQTISATATTFAAAINAPAIAQLSANTTGYACWTTGTGAISEDSVTCLASLRKLKKDIAPFTDTTAELMALKPSQFQWKNPADNNQRGQQLGFIAEDVRDVDSRLATYDGSGNLHGWRQDAMIAALVRGFQEQQAIIRHQQDEIEELKQGRLP